MPYIVHLPCCRGLGILAVFDNGLKRVRPERAKSQSARLFLSTLILHIESTKMSVIKFCMQNSYILLLTLFL